jgi:hypothetical protein
MKTIIWKEDLKDFQGLHTFIIFWAPDIIEYKNFFVFEGKEDPYELAEYYASEGLK